MRILFFAAFMVLLTGSCNRKSTDLNENFDKINDRVWVGKDFWAVPLEDWQVSGGRLEGTGDIRSRVHILTRTLNGENGDLFVSARMGLIDGRTGINASGFEIGIVDDEDSDIRAACYFGRGVNAGISTEGFIYLGGMSMQLPENFDLTGFRLSVHGVGDESGYSLTLQAEDINRVSGQLNLDLNSAPKGHIALVKNHRWDDSHGGGSPFWFDDISIKGSQVHLSEDNSFGPVLWTMYTLSNNILKLTAQMPPLGLDDPDIVSLEIKKDGKWEEIVTERIDNSARTAVFRIEGWIPDSDVLYRVGYNPDGGRRSSSVHYYEGVVRKEPEDRPMVFGGLTCQMHYGFPYTPLVRNLESKDPDILYFSGDQLYEQNGGYPVKREPVDVSILNYLGKYYMFGWAFGDLMKDRPAIVTPDDHDVYHGNLWGEGGEPMEGTNTSTSIGYIQSPEFVNVVHRTQCGHLPDPYDPTPMKRNMSVWYTSLNYGGVSFAIISDRIFKSGPSNVSFWEGREDHLTGPLEDPRSIESAELSFIGQRQKQFLKHWVGDWNGVYMKVLLSQTTLGNLATHHGNYDGFLYGDLDSGGWPKMQRDSVIRLIRKGFVFHINGDQHLTSLVQYGVDDYRDAGWSFCTPAIAVGYQRWFLPDLMGFSVNGRPEHGLANTGNYEDAFGNLNYVYAVGNPPPSNLSVRRYDLADEKASGFGIVRFDPSDRSIKIESYRFRFNEDYPDGNQFPGFPVTISQFDNYGRGAVAYLPKIEISGPEDPVIRVINEITGELEYIVRISGNSFTPHVFSHDTFTIEAGYPETDRWVSYEGVTPLLHDDDTTITISLEI